MKERPILFSGPMVRAIIEGRKTQTRRVINPQSNVTDYRTIGVNEAGVKKDCPYGTRGDRLWVKETFAIGKRDGDVIYAADPKWIVNGIPVPPPVIGGHWKPSIFMPRASSRFTLEIIDIRVERIQDITGADIQAEGFPGEGKVGGCYGWFTGLWDEINFDRGYGWNANPWVWVIEFKRIS